jgi:hypothetical protein
MSQSNYYNVVLYSNLFNFTLPFYLGKPKNRKEGAKLRNGKKQEENQSKNIYGRRERKVNTRDKKKLR